MRPYPKRAATDVHIGTLVLKVIMEPANMALTEKAGKGPVHVSFYRNKCNVSLGEGYQEAPGRVFSRRLTKKGWEPMWKGSKERALSDAEAAEQVRAIFNAARQP